MIDKLKALIFNRSFLLGAAVAVWLFSHYIFGNDNLLEQTSEFLLKHVTGQEIDFTPETDK